MIVLNFYTLLLLFSGFLGVFFSLALFLKKENAYGNRLFGTLVFAFSLHLLETSLVTSRIIDLVPHLAGISYPILFTIGPLLFLYTCHLCKIELKKKHLLHFISSGIIFILLIPFYALTALEKLERIQISRNSLTIPTLGSILTSISFMFFLYTLVYILLSFRILSQRLRKQSNRRIIELKRINWFRNAMIVYAGFITFLLLVTPILLIFFLSEFQSELNQVNLVIMSLIIYAIGYSIINNPRLFFDFKMVHNNPAYTKSLLPVELADVYINRLESLIQNEKLYLVDDLKLPDVAKKLSVSNNHLSQIINKNLNTSFTNYINEYRINTAKELLQNCVQTGYKNITTLAFNSGFNNRTSFYRVFKKMTGESPKKYWEKQITRMKK